VKWYFTVLTFVAAGITVAETIAANWDWMAFDAVITIACGIAAARTWVSESPVAEAEAILAEEEHKS